MTSNTENIHKLLAQLDPVADYERVNIHADALKAILVIIVELDARVKMLEGTGRDH